MVRLDIDAGALSRVTAFCRASCHKEIASREVEVEWDLFYRTLYPFVERLVMSNGVRRMDQDDCVQEVWIDLVQKLAADRYDPLKGHIGAWIFTLVRHKTIDFLRSSLRNPKTRSADMDFLPSPRETDPAVTFERERRRLLLHGVLAELRQRISQKTFDSLYQCSIEGKSCHWIANELGLTVAEVRYRRRRAKSSLRDLLIHRGIFRDASDSE